MGVKALLCLAALWSCTLGIPETLIEDLSQSRADHKSSNHKVKRAQEIFYGNEQNKLGPLGELAWSRTHKRGLLEDKAVEEYLAGRAQDEDPYQTSRGGRLDLLGRRTLSPYSGYSDFQLYNMMDSRKKREVKLRRFPIFRKKRESDVDPDELMAFIRLWEAEHGRNSHQPRYSWQTLDGEEDQERAALYDAPGEWLDGPLRYSPSDYWGRQTKRFMVAKRPFPNEDVDPRVHHRLVL